MDAAKGENGHSVAALSRPLGIGEMWLESCHQVHGLMHFGAVTSLQSKWQFSLEALRAAFGVLQARHPTLRTRIVIRRIDLSNSDTGPTNLTKYLVYDEPWAAYPVDVSAVTHSDATEALEVEMQVPFNDAAGPLWRIKIVTFEKEGNSPDSNSECPFQLNVMWLSHHSIMDSRSHIRFVKELTTILEQGPDHATWNPEILGPPLPVGPRIDDIVGPAPPEVLKDYSPTWMVPDSTHDGVKKEKMVSIDLVKFRVIPFEVDAPTLSALLAKCKQEGTTVHGALTAAALLAARDHILQASPDDVELAGKGALRIDWSGPACVRKYTEPPLGPDAVGMFVRPFVGMTSVSGPEIFWEMAKTTRKELVDQLEGGIWKVANNMVKAQGSLNLAFAEAAFGKAAVEANAASPTFEANVAISNLGAFTFNKKEGGGVPSVRVARLLFTSNTALQGVAFTMCLVSCDGRMDICFSYSEPFLSPASAQAYVNNMLSHLKDAITSF